MKWVFYLIVFIYMFYRAVYGVKTKDSPTISIERVHYDDNKNYFKPGVRKSISCKGAHKNQEVEWIDPTGNVVTRSTSNRVFAQEHFVPSSKTSRVPALVLVFTSFEVEDSGVWTCKTGGVTQNVSLCIIEPSQFVDTPTEVTVDSGRSITLTCQARGDPEPRVVWSRNGDMITDDVDSSKYKVMTKYNSQGFEGLLTITSLGPEDSGVYTCDAIQESPFVDNCNHIQNLNISLQVNYAPIFQDGNYTTVYGSDGERVEIVCSANGYPVPKYRWFRDVDDTLSEVGKEYVQLLNDGTEALLNITTTPSILGQSFKCQATNQYGSAHKTFKFLKTEKPKKPDEIGAPNSSDTEIQLQVSWYDDMLFPVFEVDIQYLEKESVKRKGTPREVDWKRSEIVTLKPDEEVDSSSLEDDFKGIYVTLPNLVEETDYWIRLRAINSAGSSSWSTPILASTIAKSEEAESTSKSAPMAAQTYSESTFYGIFFAGGIVVIAVTCMFAMRLV